LKRCSCPSSVAVTVQRARAPDHSAELHRMAIADVRRQAVVVDHLAQVLLDLGRGGDGLARPRLEAVAEGEQVAVRADAGVAVRAPGAAVAGLRLQHHEALVRVVLLQVPGRADAGDAGTDDQDVDVIVHGLHSKRGSSHHGKNSGMSVETLSG
jgi:hypothetical protein